MVHFVSVVQGLTLSLDEMRCCFHNENILAPWLIWRGKLQAVCTDVAFFFGVLQQKRQGAKDASVYRRHFPSAPNLELTLTHAPFDECCDLDMRGASTSSGSSSLGELYDESPRN